MNDGDFGVCFFEPAGSLIRVPKRENSLKNGCFCPKAGNRNPSFAMEEAGCEPAAGKHEGKEGRH